MIQSRPITDVDRADALAWINSWEGFRESSARAFIESFILGTFGVGVLTIGVVHFVLGWFLTIGFPIKAAIVVGIALVSGLMGGIGAARRTKRTREELIDLRKRVEAAVELGKVWVFSSAFVKSYFDEEANPVHPPLVIEFGNGKKLSLEAMEQDQFGIWEEFSGECEIVTLFENGPILSVKTATGTKHLREALDRMAKSLP